MKGDPGSIGAAEVQRLAELARLALTGPEIRQLSRELSGILSHLDALLEVAPRGEPGEVAVEGALPPAADVVGSDPLARPLSGIAPVWREPFFEVPRPAALDPGAEG